MNIKQEITEIALKFMESPEMIEFIRNGEDWLYIDDFMTIIMTSRASLEDKLSAIRLFAEKLRESGNTLFDWTSENILKHCKLNAKLGLYIKIIGD